MIGREGIAAINRRLLRDFETPSPEEVWWWGLRTTSGTTGSPVVNIIRREEVEWFYHARRSVMCLGTLGIRLHGVKNARRDFLQKNTVLALDGKDLTPALGMLLAEYAPTHFIGFPSFIMRASADMPPASTETVEGLEVVGETMTESLFCALKQRFPNATVRSMYVAAEFGVISKVNCPYLPRNWFHPLPDISIEVNDPDERGVGDLLVSGKRHGAVFVERYKIGDVGRVEKRQCFCGDLSAFSVVGRRGHDYVKLNGALLWREEFDRVLARFKTVKDYRAIASQRPSNGKLRSHVSLHLQAPRRDSWERDIGERISKELFVTPTRTFQELVASGEFLPLEIVWQEDPFPSKHKDIKLVQAQHESNARKSG